MNTERMALGTALCPQDQRAVLARYVYRMTVESVRQWPTTAATMRARGFRLPLLTDAQWLACTRFAVRRDGRLDQRSKYCHTSRPGKVAKPRNYHACRHTVCRHCDQDIEGFAPYRKGEWRDRGNNWTCPNGPNKDKAHAPYRDQWGRL